MNPKLRKWRLLTTTEQAGCVCKSNQRITLLSEIEHDMEEAQYSRKSHVSSKFQVTVFVIQRFGLQVTDTVVPRSERFRQGVSSMLLHLDMESWLVKSTYKGFLELL